MIPKIIIQTWKSNDNLRPDYKKNQDKIKKLHPDYEYKFFTDDDVNQLFDTKYPHLKRTIKKFKRKIQIIDLFRLVAVYEYGGFYFDMDFVLNKKLDDLLKHEVVFPVEMMRKHEKFLIDRFNKNYNIGNYAFGASPRNPIILKMINNIVRAIDDPEWAQIPNDNFHDYVYFTTGPILVTRTIWEEDPELKTVTLLYPPGWPRFKSWFRFGNYGKHVMTGTWKPKNVGILKVTDEKSIDTFDNDEEKSSYNWPLIIICLIITTFLIYIIWKKRDKLYV